MILSSSERLLENKMKVALSEFGHKGDKVRIICKCNTMEEAEEMAVQSGLGRGWFAPGCCNEVKNEGTLDLLSVLRGADMAVCVDGNNFLAIDSDVRERLLR